MPKIYTGTYKRPDDWKPGKDGQPSEHARAVVAAMFAELEKAKEKELHCVLETKRGDVFQRGAEFGYGQACEEDDLTGPFATAEDAEKALVDFCEKCGDTKDGCWKKKES